MISDSLGVFRVGVAFGRPTAFSRRRGRNPCLAQKTTGDDARFCFQTTRATNFSPCRCEPSARDTPSLSRPRRPFQPIDGWRSVGRQYASCFLLGRRARSLL
jgi:hypothetical protein